MKILFVSDHQCTRTFKEMIPLKELGHTMYSVSAATGTGYNLYDFSTIYWRGEDPRNPTIRSHFIDTMNFVIKADKPDVIHCHNEPDWICEESIKIAEKLNIPVVWDLHDIESARWKMIPLEEQRIMQKIDGIVVPSDGCKAWINENHAYYKNPIITILSCFPDYRALKKYNAVVPQTYDSVDGRIPNSIVYEGGLFLPSPGDVKPENSLSMGEMNFRDYRGIIKEMSKSGFNVHLYPSDARIGERRMDMVGYMDYGGLVEKSEDAIGLIKALSQYEFGLCGFPFSGNPLCERAIPNKFFDYMMAGVIPIVINCKETADIIAKNKIGFISVTPADLEIVLNTTKEQRTQIRQNIIAYRETIYSNVQITKLLGLYNTVIKNKKRAKK